MNNPTTLVLAFSLFVAVQPVPPADAGPPQVGRAPVAKSDQAKNFEALRQAAAAKRALPKLASGVHAGNAGAVAVARPDLVNVIPRVDYDQFAWNFSNAIMKPTSPCGFKTYFRVQNHSKVAAPPSLLKLECQFVPSPEAQQSLASSNLTVEWWGAFVCGQIRGWKSVPALQPGETSAESESMMAYVMLGDCSLTHIGYPRVRFTVDGNGKVEEGRSGESNNSMWVNFCY